MGVDGGFYTTGSWRPFPGKEDDFVEAWEEFAGWGSAFEGAGTATLARDLRDEGVFTSFMDWDSVEAIRAWKTHPEFKERMGQVQQYIDTFAPTELKVVARPAKR
jgi:heme-degrading monooxygenase HmoA